MGGTGKRAGRGDVVLAGDIGATHARLAIYRATGRRLGLVGQRTLPSRRHGGLAAVVEAFLKSVRPRPPAIARACFGVPGPVRDGRCRTTNLPWVVDADRIRKRLGIPAVDLINDLEACGRGIADLGEGDLAVIQAGRAGARGNAALIAAGTGLGEAGLFWDGRGHRPFATEGGHASFAPRDEREAGLLRFLSREFDHVSWERVLSGPGLHAIYRFLQDGGTAGEPAWLADEMRRGDPAEVISRAALEGHSRRCAAALDLFVSLYGAEAGNLALKMLATGGVYLGGGIAPRILPRLSSPLFLEAFAGKGRMRPLLAEVPVRVILNGGVALLGAARFAAGRAAIRVL